MYLEKVNSPYDLKKLEPDELELYAEEVRQYIRQTVAECGGHLASNLGAVELTVALHYVFDCYKDKILFDVGHQSYTHKIITGRRDAFKGLRKNGGISGFPSPKESDADIFTTGHSSTSLSLSLGIARARDLSGENYNILPVIGDGSFTGGMVYEALNDIGENKTKLTIILNDNKMSISKNTGAISKYFTKLRLSRRYNGIKNDIKKAVYALPFISVTKNKVFRKAKVRVKEFFLASRLFENFGISYYGPIDGHNIKELIHTFKRVALKNHPSIIHVVTKKGKGDAAAEENPDIFHGFTAANRDKVEEKPTNNCADSTACDGSCYASSCKNEIQPSDKKDKSFSLLAGRTLAELAGQDEKIVAITAAMGLGTGLDEFARRYPKRYFDVSIAEQHAVSLAAGMAKAGYKPFFAVYSTFLQRGFDQVLHEVALNSLPVRFLIDRAGAIGSDGATHQGVYDLSYLSLIPNVTVLSPKDGDELVKMIKWANGFGSPVCIRYPKDYAMDFPQTCEIEYGKWQILKKHDSDIYILASGNRMNEIVHNIQCANIINASFIKPLDFLLLDKINKKGNLIITLEDNVLQGGFGSAVLSYLNKTQIYAKVVSFAHPDSHITNLNVGDTFRQSKITKEEVLAVIDSFLAQKS